MFTGLVQEIGKIANVTLVNNKKHVTINCHSLQTGLSIGESVACNGICLTVITFNSQTITVEIMNQTIKTTTAYKWTINDTIHLEPAMTLSTRLNGHLVQGHIDTITKLKNKFKEGNTLYLEFNLPNDYKHLLVDHGSICIDGVSLTIARLFPDSFQVALISHTLLLTHLGKLNVNDEVNIEFDIIGKYVQRQLCKNQKSIITEEWVEERLGKR